MLCLSDHNARVLLQMVLAIVFSDLCGPTEFGSAAPINAQRWAVASRVGVLLMLLE
jgi:hypothetical protein